MMARVLDSAQKKKQQVKDMRILVAGATGQVAQSLSKVAPEFPGLSLHLKGRPDLDISDLDSVSRALTGGGYDYVINAAAYTAVDLAEDEKGIAFAVNAEGAGNLAKVAAQNNCPIIHYSTDYVFDGQSRHPYSEGDLLSPLSVYGRSKLDGEQAVKAANPKHLIFRTAWVHSEFGKNFVKTMLRLAEELDEVSVVNDQIGSPTYAGDIATETLRIISLLQGKNAWGTYHLVNSGEASWAEVAERVFSESRRLSGPYANVTPITSAEFPQKVTRPKNSRLSTSKLSSVFSSHLRDWQTGVRASVERILGN